VTKLIYCRLDEVLRSLGFSVRVVKDKARLNEHSETGALIALPMFPLTKSFMPRHLAVARTTLDLYGIATPMEFTTSLQKAS
jgi:hypothetical protein